MTQRQSKRKSGFTLIECMLSAVLLMVVFAGIMTFRYYTVFCAEKAENELLAARAACLLSEAWRGCKGDTAFDPLQQDFDTDFRIAAFGSGYSAGAGVSTLGSYTVTLDNKDFTAHLVYGSAVGVQGLRTIQIIMTWQDTRGVQQEYRLSTLTQTDA